MATKKQRKRQQKLRRHEWEEVYIDEEGREIPVEEIDVPEPAAPRARKAEAAKSRAPAAARTRGGRVIQPPSWQRVLKRAAIFAPIMFLVVNFLSKNLTLQQKVVQTLLLLAFFIPFSYLIDVLMYLSLIHI